MRLTKEVHLVAGGKLGIRMTYGSSDGYVYLINGGHSHLALIDAGGGDNTRAIIRNIEARRREERAIIEALRTCWPEVPHQRCQAHFLNNLVEPVLAYDVDLRERMRQDLGGLPKVSASPREPGDPDGPPF